MATASVQPIPVPPSEPLVPNQFSLQGRGISITFSSTSFSGQPLLHYEDGYHEVNASGDDIRQVETELGTLVTVTLEPDADAGELLLTLLIPRARLAGPGSEVRISTEALLTRSRLPRGPASSAQLQMYMVVALRGQASFVVS